MSTCFPSPFPFLRLSLSHFPAYPLTHFPSSLPGVDSMNLVGPTCQSARTRGNASLPDPSPRCALTTCEPGVSLRAQVDTSKLPAVAHEKFAVGQGGETPGVPAGLRAAQFGVLFGIGRQQDQL